jgi:hypothetical protein
VTAFELIVKQTEYEVRTLEEVVRLKSEGLGEMEIANLVGISGTEVRLASEMKLKGQKND